MADFSKYLLEQSFSRVLDHTKNRAIGIISASRGDIKDPAENNRRHEQLKADLRASGHGFVRIRGSYIEHKGEPNERKVSEKSLLVIGRKSGDDKGELLGRLKKLGQKYGQDSILHKAHNEPTAKLHGTNHAEFPGFGKTADVGEWHPNRAGEYHSLLKGKPSKPFQFGEQVLFDPTTVYEDYTFWNAQTWFSRKERLF